MIVNHDFRYTISDQPKPTFPTRYMYDENNKFYFKQ